MFSKIGYRECIDICWDITSVCNFDCPYCFNKREYSKSFVFTRPMIDAALELISRIKLPVVVGILGGEPTLHPLLNYIISKLISLNNVEKVKIVSNSRKDMSYIIQHPKVHLCLSYHPLKNSFYIDNLKLPRTTLYLLMVRSALKNVLDLYNKALEFNIPIIPEYIVAPDDSIKIFESIVPDPSMYIDDGNLLSFKDACKTSFKGCTCKLSHYKITANGDVLLECPNETLGTIYDKDISAKITIRPIKCPNEYCGDDFLMEMMKE